jgi:ATP-dependent DNA helicase Rep
MLDKNGSEQDAVQLATLHAAKGLEFRHVFLVGIEEGILPHRESIDPAKIEEERRLMYVGITRARQSLHVSHCRKRAVGKEWRECEPSRFIGEMGDDLRHAGNGNDAPAEKSAGRARLAQFKTMLSNT